MDLTKLVGTRVDGHVDSKIFKARNGVTYPYETWGVTLPDEIKTFLEASGVPYRLIYKGGVYTQDIRSDRLNLKIARDDAGFFISEIYYG